MDDRTWYLAVATLSAAALAMFVDAGLSRFEVPNGFWAVLSGVLGFLGARAALRRNGNGDDSDRK